MGLVVAVSVEKMTVLMLVVDVVKMAGLVVVINK